MKRAKSLIVVAFAGILSGCNLVVMDPSGDIAIQQRDLIVYSTVLMLIVIIPVMLLTIFFAIKYRASNEDAAYEPDWDHSISLEIVIWTVPLAIIICLAGLTYVATHRLNPYDPIKRISADEPINEELEPMIVQVVALDWKWLFIYPEYGVASVNEAAAIVDRPIEFQITSTTVMNSFFIPAMAGQIYAMPAMETELNAVINEPGVYEGFSANYSGLGFTYMQFNFHGLAADEFDTWVQKVKDGGVELDRATMLKLNQPSIKHPITYYDSVDPELWDAIVNRCVDQNDLCNNDMMMVDALGGGGIDGLWNRQVFAGLCNAEDPEAILSFLRPQMSKQDNKAVVAAMTLMPPQTTPK